MKGAVRNNESPSAEKLRKEGSACFLRSHLKGLAPYTPIEPFEVLSAKLGKKPEDIVKLDANENPYGPPASVLRALGEMKFPNIYPDPETRQLREKLGDAMGVPEGNILVGCGADELIDLLMRCVLDPGDTVVDSPPTFTMYAFDAEVNAAKAIQVPRLDGFRMDIEGVAEAVHEHSAKMVFVTSPNNPDGGVISDEDLEALLDLPALIVLDEAYIEFAEAPSRAKWVMERDNMIVLRTFSKSAGLAGLRVGYGVFPDGLVEYLWRAKQPYNVSVAAELAACVAMDEAQYMADVRDKLVQERERMMVELGKIPFLQPFPSHSNFILCAVTGMDALDVKMQLQGMGIMVRHYNKPLLSGYIRISVGTPEQTGMLLAALDQCK